MCGISALISLKTATHFVKHNSKDGLLARRGPDGFGTVQFHEEVPSCTPFVLCVELTASVLHLRGETVVTQPLLDNQGNILLWNGEVFGGTAVHVKQGENDTHKVSSALSDMLGEMDDSGTVLELLAEFFARLQGPWSFLFWHRKSNSLFFGRDVWGRRSLLLNRQTAHLKLSSVINDDSDHVSVRNDEEWMGALRQWEEIPPATVYCLNFGYGTIRDDDEPFENSGPLSETESISMCVLDNTSCDADKRINVPLSYKTARGVETCTTQDCTTRDFPRPICPVNVVDIYAHRLLEGLLKATAKRISHVPRCSKALRGCHPKYHPASVALLFSGGLDSMVLAAATHLCIAIEEPIDLINVCFDAPAHSSPDRQTAIQGFKDLSKRFPARRWQLIRVDRDSDSLNSLDTQYHLLRLLAPCTTRMDYSIGAALWFASQAKGHVMYVNPDYHRGEDQTWKTIQADIRRLYYTTCHENQHHPPDNEGNRDSLAENALQWWKDNRSSPNTESTTRDVSCEVNGETIDISSIEDMEVSSTSKVLLSGIGADEQLGGYGRHATAYKRGEWECLREEMDKDILRLWKRNLGRDDRIVSDNSKEIRAPFLDEEVASLISDIPLPILTDPRLPRGQGDKRILRRIGQLLGLTGCSSLEKRAIQFGSRVARKCNEAAMGSRHRKACGTDEYRIIYSPNS